MTISNGRLYDETTVIPPVVMPRCRTCDAPASTTNVHLVFVARCQFCGRLSLETPIHRVHRQRANGDDEPLNACPTCAASTVGATSAAFDRIALIHLCDECDVFTRASRIAIYRERFRTELGGRDHRCMACGETMLYALHRRTEDPLAGRILCRECFNVLRGRSRLEDDHVHGPYKEFAPQTEPLPANLNAVFGDVMEGELLRLQYTMARMAEWTMAGRRIRGVTATEPRPVSFSTMPPAIYPVLQVSREGRQRTRASVCAPPSVPVAH